MLSCSVLVNLARLAFQREMIMLLKSLFFFVWYFIRLLLGFSSLGKVAQPDGTVD